MAKVIARLRKKFPQVSPETVEQIVRQEHRALDGRPVRDFIAVLVEHEARQRLRAMSVPVQAAVPGSVPRAANGI
ncbi:hypothetical protein D6T64_04835 [Cryobacterium melibiosiphilum]|uniref:DUF3562 domain-containing protein n=1 Tax=Cryobacterium melibiosiphilum TaxID=995039 RepID=A0A3A5MY81_9MICO|nr:hypothetical protein D6T64_04835 [Cryobacterium melibiosiphilum]